MAGVRVQLDHNATTPLRPEVRALLVDRLERLRGNPSSVHASGREARAWLDEARERTAAALGCHEEEVVFTSGGTESIQIALAGAARAAGPGRGLVTTRVEHSAVLAAAERLEREGRPVERLPVDAQGRVRLEDLDRALDAQGSGARHALVSIQAANNELGTLQPLAAVGERLAAWGPGRPLFHTDAVQALGKIPVRLAEWRADLASFSLHKVGGPLGVGLLIRRRGVAVEPLLGSGSQEGGLRPGTENVPAISAGALAVELAVREQEACAARVRALCLSCWHDLQLNVPGIELNGPPVDAPHRLPNTLNVSFPGADGRTLVARLDLEGLEVSAGSACASGSLEPSHVLLALGHAPERARAALRLSFGRTSGEQDVHNAVDILRRTILALR
jgi:cysteine desulfurase